MNLKCFFEGFWGIFLSYIKCWYCNYYFVNIRYLKIFNVGFFCFKLILVFVVVVMLEIFEGNLNLIIWEIKKVVYRLEFFVICFVGKINERFLE